MDQTRKTQLDIIRIFAVFTVLSVHFFLNNQFYDTPIVGVVMYVAVVFRSFFMTCVPLFLVLSGYCMAQKLPSKKYYFGIVKTLCIYLLASIACGLFKLSLSIEGDGIQKMIGGIFSFTTATYAWYINMYIGLFLLIPFLNLIYHNLQGQRQKIVLIATLLFLTAIPPIINIFNFTGGNPNDNMLQIIPNWWTGIYPITYYFIGCYLKEYGLKLNRAISAGILLLVMVASGSFQYYRSYGGNFVYGMYQDWGALPNVIMTVLIFHILCGLECSNRWPSKIRSGLKLLSDWTLGAYLVSYIFDVIFYKRLNANVPDMKYKLLYYIIIVPAVFVCSLLLSGVLNGIYTLLHRIVLKCKEAGKRFTTTS